MLNSKGYYLFPLVSLALGCNSAIEIESSPCTVQESGDGTKTISCDDGTIVTVVDSDGDPGINTDTDTGIQTETDTGIQAETDTDSTTVDVCDGYDENDFEYPSRCVGDECTSGSCCQGAVCGEELFGTDGFMTHYCFPEPGPPGPGQNPCQCDDIAVEFDVDQPGTQTWTACLQRGIIESTANVRFPIYSKEYIDNRPDQQLDSADVRQFPSTVLKTEITSLSSAQQPTFTLGFGIEDFTDLDNDGEDDDQTLYLIHQGIKGLSTLWMMQTVISGNFWASGTLQYTKEAENNTNFEVTLLKGKLAGNAISNLWIETITLHGYIEIETAAELCETAGGAGCTDSSVGYNLDIVRVKAEVDMSTF